jgi:hypothetical protein
MRNAIRLNGSLALLPLALAIAGCGSGSLDLGGSDSNPTTASAAGIWVGTDSASGLTLTGIIDAAGAADFIRSDGTQYFGTAQVSGTALDVTLDVYTQFGNQFGDGSTYAVGTFSGMINGSSLSGNVSFTTTDNNAVMSMWSLTFDTLYNTASSLSDISGNYMDTSSDDPLSGAAVSISGTGAITAQSASTGCVLNGQVSTVSTSSDAYAVSYTLENCAGADAVLNGIALSGLALLNSNASPVQIVLGVRGQSASGSNYGIASVFTLNN